MESFYPNSSRQHQQQQLQQHQRLQQQQLQQQQQQLLQSQHNNPYAQQQQQQGVIPAGPSPLSTSSPHSITYHQQSPMIQTGTGSASYSSTPNTYPVSGGLFGGPSSEQKTRSAGNNTGNMNYGRDSYHSGGGLGYGGIGGMSSYGGNQSNDHPRASSSSAKGDNGAAGQTGNGSQGASAKRGSKACVACEYTWSDKNLDISLTRLCLQAGRAKTGARWTQTQTAQPVNAVWRAIPLACSRRLQTRLEGAIAVSPPPKASAATPKGETWMLSMENHPKLIDYQEGVPSRAQCQRSSSRPEPDTISGKPIQMTSDAFNAERLPLQLQQILNMLPQNSSFPAQNTMPYLQQQDAGVPTANIFNNSVSPPSLFNQSPSSLQAQNHGLHQQNQFMSHQPQIPQSPQNIATGRSNESGGDDRGRNREKKRVGDFPKLPGFAPPVSITRLHYSDR